MGLAKKIGENILWRGIYLASLFVINLLMARVLGAGESGAFYLLVNNLSLFILITGFCLESSFIYFGASGRIGLPKMATLSLAWSFIAWCIAIIIIFYAWPKSLERWSIFWLASYISSFILINTSTAIFQAQNNFRSYSIVLLLTNILLIFILFFLSGGLPFKYITIQEEHPENLRHYYAMVAYFIIVFLQGILLFGICWLTLIKPGFQLPTLVELKMLFKYASQALLTNIVFFLVYRVDYWFMNYFWRGDDLGNYIQVSKLVQLFMVIPSLMATNIFSAAAKGDEGKLKDQLTALGRVLFTLYLVILILLAITGSFLFPLLYGQSFSGMYIPFLLLIPGILALALHSLITSYYAGINKVKVNLTGAIIALGFILLLDYLLIPRFSGEGAAIASSVGYLAYAFFMFYKFWKHLGISFSHFLIMKHRDWKWIRQKLVRTNK